MRHSGLPLAIAGSHASTHILPEHRRAQNADHLAHNTPFSAFFTKVVCDLGATPPQVAASPSPIGGIALHEPPTRRRHAARRLRVVQTPTTAGVEGTGGAGGHGRLRDAGQAAAPVGGRQGLAGQRADAPSEARGADGSRAGRRPRAHKAARPRTTARGPLHPLRAAAPVTGRCTRSEGVHCLQIGCSAPNHKNKRGICETIADTQKVGERTKCVGFVATFRRVGAGQSTLKGELFQAAGHRARGAPPALDVGSGAGPVCIVAAESKRVCATSLLTQWCPAWRCARPWASSVGRTGSGRACGVGSGVRRDGCAV